MKTKKGFKLKVTVFDGKEDCLRALGERVRHAKTDEEIYKIFCIRIEILILYGEDLKALRLLEECIGYYKSVDMTQTVSKLLELKKTVITREEFVNIKDAE
jgi:hypothetical protein